MVNAKNYSAQKEGRNSSRLIAIIFMIFIAKKFFIKPKITESEKAYFSTGKFWQIAQDVQSLNGVIFVAKGYFGGNIGDYSYEKAEKGYEGISYAVEVLFDSQKISYKDLVLSLIKIMQQHSKDYLEVRYQSNSEPKILTVGQDQFSIASEVINSQDVNLESEKVIFVEELRNFHKAEQDFQRFNYIK